MEPSHSVAELIALKISDGLYSYRTLGQKLGVSHAYLNNVVKGRQRPPKTKEFYVKLADAIELQAASITEYRIAVLREKIQGDSEFLEVVWQCLKPEPVQSIEGPSELGGRLGLSIYLDRYTVEIDGKPISLSFKEFELLRVLTSEVDRVFTRDNLLETVWGYDYFGGTRTVDVHITRLRAKLGSLSMLIETVRQVGYRFTGPVEIT